MTKPIREIGIATVDDGRGKVNAVFDSGSFYSIIREDKIPAGVNILRYPTPHEFRAAAKGSKLTTIGELSLVMTIGKNVIKDIALISPELSQEMLIGAGTMQLWDITIRNTNGKTEIVVGHDMRDPNIIEVD